MLARYSFDRSFITSGDLRIFMAMNTSEYDISKFAQYDNLIQISPAKVSVLYYNTEALAAREDFHKDLDKGASILTDAYGTELRLNNVHRGGTCILIGSGASLDVDFVKDMRDKGVPVIAMGDATRSYPYADYWCANRDVAVYDTNALYCPRTFSVVHDRCKDEKVWDYDKSRETNSTLRTMAGVMYIPEEPFKGIDDWFEEPFITDFGLGSTFGIGMSLAVCLGFSNIILSGVDMGGDIDSFYSFDDIPALSVMQAKNDAYKEVVGFFDVFKRELTARAIRVLSVDKSPFHIPPLGAEYLSKSVESTLRSYSPEVTPIQAETRPMNTKVHYTKALQKHRSARLDAVELYGYIPALMERAPHFFDTPEVVSAYDKTTVALERGGCSDCVKRRLLRPVLNILIRHVQDNRSEMHEIWEEVIPNKYTVEINKKLVYRRDKKHEETALARYKG